MVYIKLILMFHMRICVGYPVEEQVDGGEVPDPGQNRERAEVLYQPVLTAETRIDTT